MMCWEDYTEETDMEDEATEMDTENEAAETFMATLPTPAQVPVMRYVTIALVMLAILVQCSLIRQCTQAGQNVVYCVLAN